ncbi:hypothetical protein PAPYR_5020 [Paratrimastix pyriformis]|uniref:F-box domain-containing protein n=1 Tax=Paratrimastix pyriformis TaxID=342808 RepID=A0ABQ8UNA6_9EUKA|nr:hypothetical protein PAPYR_5020 [Paratrimastix pyriformis]
MEALPEEILLNIFVLLCDEIPPQAMLDHPLFSWREWYHHSLAFVPLMDYSDDIFFSSDGRTCQYGLGKPYFNISCDRPLWDGTVWFLFRGITSSDTYRLGLMLELPDEWEVPGRRANGWGFCSFDRSFGHNGDWGPYSGPAPPDGVPVGLTHDRATNRMAIRLGLGGTPLIAGNRSGPFLLPTRDPQEGLVVVVTLIRPCSVTLLGLTHGDEQLPWWMQGVCETPSSR